MVWQFQSTERRWYIFVKTKSLECNKKSVNIFRALFRCIIYLGPLQYLPQGVDDILSTVPGHHTCLELSRFGFLHLLNQFMHWEIPAWECYIAWWQCEWWAKVIGPIAHVQNLLVGSSASLTHALGHILPYHHRLAHVCWAPQALMGVEGLKLQLPIIIKVSRVGENVQKQWAEA